MTMGTDLIFSPGAQASDAWAWLSKAGDLVADWRDDDARGFPLAAPLRRAEAVQLVERGGGDPAGLEALQLVSTEHGWFLAVLTVPQPTVIARLRTVDGRIVVDVVNRRPPAQGVQRWPA